MSQQVRNRILLGSLQAGADVNAVALVQPEQALCFYPGRRTRDDGSLGAVDGRVVLKIAAPPANQSVLWRVVSSVGEVVDEVTTTAPHEIELLAAHPGRFRLELALANAVLEPRTYEISAPIFLSVLLGPHSIGVILDELGIADDNQQRQLLVDRLTAVARRVAAHALRPLNVRLLWPDDDIPAHFMPSAPVQGPSPDRLATAAVIEREKDGDLQQFYPGLRYLHVGAPQKILPSIPAYEKISDILDTKLAAAKEMILADLRARFGVRMNALLDQLAMLFARKGIDTDWGTSRLLEVYGFGQVLFGGGVRQFDGEAVGSHSPVAHRILATLADAAQQENWDMGKDATRSYVEMAGRMLGTQIAVAALRMAGLRVYESAPTGIEGVAWAVHTDLLASAPTRPEQDFFGLYRPETEGAPRSLDHLIGDLAAQETPADSTRWVDLCQTIASPTAALIGAEPTTRYDALAGLVSTRSLLAIRGLTGTLPAPYGPYTLRWGDQDRPDTAQGDDLPVYGGETFSASDRPRKTQEIALLQADLLRVGITLGQREIGKYGYRRWTNDAGKWDGALGAQPIRVSVREPVPDDPDKTRVNLTVSRPRWNALCDGDVSIAVREFQIAATYPKGVMEAVTPEPVFVKRLRVAFEEEQARPVGSALGAPNINVNGMLSPDMADRLRMWVFTRRRIPNVVIGGSRDDAYAAADANRPFIQNIMSAAYDAHPRISSAYRFYSVDKSGRFGEVVEPVEPVVLGRASYSDRMGRLGYWGGLWHPTNGEMNATDFTAANTFDPVGWQLSDDLTQEERQKRIRRRSVFRVVAALARVESIQHWDGFNAWDDAIFSWPPFHFTLTLGANGGNGGVTSSPNLMGAVIEFMRNPPQDVLEGAYPSPEPSGDPGADAVAQAGIIAQRQALETRMRQCYWDNFGVYGVGASAINKTHSPGSFVTLSGLIDASDATRTVHMDRRWVNGAAGRPQQAIYQAYQQWFRSWTWGQRFALHVRHKPLLRMLTFVYSIHWAHAVLARTEGWQENFGIETNGNDVLRSEQARTVYLRLYIRAPGHAVSARRALGRIRAGATDIETFHRNTTENRIVDALVGSVDGNVRETAEIARDFLVPDGLGRPSIETDADNAAADFLQVRNELLTDIMNVDWDDL